MAQAHVPHSESLQSKFGSSHSPGLPFDGNFTRSVFLVKFLPFPVPDRNVSVCGSPHDLLVIHRIKHFENHREEGVGNGDGPQDKKAREPLFFYMSHPVFRP